MPAILPTIDAPVAQPPGLAARLTLAAAAVGAAAWLGISLAFKHGEVEAFVTAINGGGSPAENAEARRMARNARRFQPDSGPKLVEAALLTQRGRRREAQLLLQDVVRMEPENAQAWHALSRTAQDPALRREARRRVLVLQGR
ncbi:MAG TPA: hypothetical protein VHG69_13385 [Thermoleophilaceae bacterium]|nr:hypothetical protein [Thermoleophilaceae bacterium]